MSQSGWNFEHTYSDLSDIFHKQVQPTPVAQPKLLVWNAPLAQALGLSGEPPADAAALFAGNSIPEGAKPLAQASSATSPCSVMAGPSCSANR